ncbi:MAG TPA: arginine--tRNA ligase, partial [Pyrinomonadaceae bacterium]|nr:arginine--tRNA ligase [Pyrinomonadaceae bacterium]
MTLLNLQQQLKERIRTAAREMFGVEVQQLTADTPPRPELGDLAFPVCFELAKLIKQATGEKTAPRTIAEKLKPVLEEVPEVSRVDIAGAGYINVFFDRARLLQLFSSKTAVEITADMDHGKMMVEHTSINPNKAAHIGHVRNAVLGDTFVRILQAAGDRVEVQNYIDNTGVQVADVVAGFHYLAKKGPAEVQALINDPAVRFDYYCWDLYARTSQHYENEP